VTRRLVVEADGGSRGNPGPAAYGAIVRDAATGAVLAERSEAIGVASNNVAEYRGLIAGLTAAAELDPAAEIDVRLDSKLIVEQMSGRWKVKHPDMLALVKEAFAAYTPDRVRYTWVPREQNKAADRLVNAALDGPRVRPPGADPRSAPEPDAWAAADRAGSSTTDDAAASRTMLRIAGWEQQDPPTRQVLLRHGATPHTADRRFSGMGGEDPGLSDEGREQARRAAEALVGRGIDVIVASPMRRTRQTAEIAAAALGLEVEWDDGFVEASFGVWEGLTFGEVMERTPDDLRAWLSSTAVAPPGGESLDAVTVRVRRARDRVLARHGGRTVLTVSHVTPINTLVRLAIDAPASSVYRMRVQPGALSTVEWYADGAASLQAYNDDAHLR
jgi:probable phosphoglycerate mutase